MSIAESLENDTISADKNRSNNLKHIMEAAVERFSRKRDLEIVREMRGRPTKKVDPLAYASRSDFTDD